jgi:DNA-binding MarR family transcriptional regulator
MNKIGSEDSMRSKPSKNLTGRGRKRVGSDEILPVTESIGYQIRMTHRVLQRYLQTKIEPHGVTLGMWYYLRTLWEEDGLTQRELSLRIETMEPSTLTAIQVMERKGVVRRVRSLEDRRKLHVFLTPKGKALKTKLLPLARQVAEDVTVELSPSAIKALFHAVAEIRKRVKFKLNEADLDKS